MAKETLTEAIAVAKAPEDTVTKKSSSFVAWIADKGIFVFTAILILASMTFVDGFASLQNVTDLFHRAAPIGIVALGMTFVVITGNYLDLSVVAQAAAAGVILIAVSNAYNLITAFIVAFIVAIIFGLVNGIAVGYFKANAVIVTLSTTYIGLGLLRLLSGGSQVFGPFDGPIATFGTSKLGPFPYSAVVLVVVTLILTFVLSKTNFGFMVRSFGVNERSTRLAGTNTGVIVIGAFLVTSMAAMIGGFVLAAFSNTAVSNMATGYDFQALAAIIVGGTSVFGGKGSVPRTLLGVVFVSILSNVLVLSQISYGWQQIAIGSLIVFAVTVDALGRRVGKK
ncbi:MAG: ABC transporter permease [Micrococcales bacterium]|jgi:ribose transport system permease protein|nr:ABC transporter permease [Micrococcales bacterium]MBT5431482.1 ABC transporter permease [Micrococcales bacterium]MDA7806896.1 ABC transporter permease [Aquiluna sp.]